MGEAWEKQGPHIFSVPLNSQWLERNTLCRKKTAAEKRKRRR
jgi:hypothetical protein